MAHGVSVKFRRWEGVVLLRDVVLLPGSKRTSWGPMAAGSRRRSGVPATGELESDPPSARGVLAAAMEAKLPSGVPEPGHVRRAENLKVVVFSQHRTELDPSMTLLWTALSPADSVIYRGKLVHVARGAQRLCSTPSR